MNNISIYVQSHAKLPLLFADGYHPMIRGMGRDFVRSDILVDTVGDNISDKEFMPDFNTLYWIWKNTDLPEYIGVCHYRRYFNFSGEPLNPDGSNFFECVNVTHAVNLLKDADVILLPPNRAVLKEKVAGQFFRCHFSKYMFLAFKIVCRMHPEYRASFLHVMNSNVLHARAMFVTKKQIFCQFMEFFSLVLFELERTALRDYPHEKKPERFIGYVCERLMDVFWFYNNLRIKECNLIQLKLEKGK